MIEFLGKKLNAPLIASSCPATENAERVLRLEKAGIGGAILKSCADYVRGEYSGKRRYLKCERGYYASSPFEREILTLGEAISLLEELRAKTDMLLIASFTADSIDPAKWLEPCRRLIGAGADAVQADLFYMHNLLGDRDFSERFISLLAMLNELGAPVIPKLSVNLPANTVMPWLKKAGIEYVSLLDSVRVPPLRDEKGEYPGKIDPDSSSLFGGWMLPLTVSYTYAARKAGLKPVSGGGITSANDVRHLFDAGAELVQSASLLMKNENAWTELFDL